MSNNVYVIADLHIGHTNIANHRGFKNAEEMWEVIKSNWNSTINKKDTVWILGDIAMEKIKYYSKLNELNGIKKVVLGNHDKPQHIPELLKYVSSVCGCIQLKGYILTHIPIHESELLRFKGNIHGHIHNEEIVDSRYINVSCEAVNYYPIQLKDLINEQQKMLD